jgi:hypothetical protein
MEGVKIMLKKGNYNSNIKCYNKQKILTSQITTPLPEVPENETVCI